MTSFDYFPLGCVPVALRLLYIGRVGIEREGNNLVSIADRVRERESQRERVTEKSKNRQLIIRGCN